MTTNTYQFIFQCYTDGSVKIDYQPEPPFKKNGTPKFKKQDMVLPVLRAPEGCTDTMTLVQMNFTSQRGTVSPFGDGSQPSIDWKPGDAMLETVDDDGLWAWWATLTSSSGKTYQLPDPELQVGVGPGPSET